MTPDGWTVRQLGDFCEPISARANGVELPILSVSKDLGIVLQSEKFKRRVASENTSNYKRIQFGEFVFDPMLLWAGNIGRQRRVPEGVVSPAYTVFRTKALVNDDYLEHFLKRTEMLHHYKVISRGTNVRRQKVLFNDFAGLRFAMPPLAEQRKIATILSSVDEVIEATQVVIDQLGVVKQAMMAELLTRGLPGRHTRFKQTEIGDVPEAWELIELQQVVIDGPTNGLYKPAHMIGRGALVAGMTAIDGSSLDWALCRRAELDREELERFGLRENDLLVTRVYAKVEGIGRFVVVPCVAEPVGYESNMMRVRLDPERAIPEFVSAHMALPRLRKEIELRATLGVQASINNEGVRTLPLRLPPLAEQREVADVLASIKRRLDAEARSIIGLRAAKTSLMSVLLTGEVRVKPDEDAA